MADAAVQLAANVWRIPTTPFDLVNSFAFADDDGQVTLVDTGVRRAAARIVAGLEAIGRHPSDVTSILLTHAHADHSGGAAGLSARTGGKVAVHADDAPFARRGKAPDLDPSRTGGRLAMRLRPFMAFPPVEVAEELHDGQLLPVAGGLRVVHTPGHTPGHVSLLHPASGVLITGDSIFNVLGLRWPPKSLCTDVRLTQVTADRLGELEYSVAAFTHGPHIAERARERVRGFLARARRS